ncbi:MAG TPA: hypothetical protein VFQ35_01400 [Polyangiaceae bacterium]|nr:hypothetical protein [Polyangiaceae bacterium]
MPSLLRVVCFALSLSACASHSDRTQAIRSALDAGDAKSALKYVNERLDVDNEKDVPNEAGSEKSLFLLDRAMILQQLDHYELSSRDLELADKQIDLLDLSRNALDSIGKYLFSDDVGRYKAPPYEKLLINTENMVNYLARGDLNGARIEARRLSVMQKYLRDHEDPAQALTAAGSYLAGFTFEKSGKTSEALNYYDDALATGAYASLAAPVKRLLAQTGSGSARLQKLAATTTEEIDETDAEILIVVGYGRVPFKIARRVPIGLALTYVSDALSPTDRARANQLAAQGLVTWVNYPELGPAQGSIGIPRGRIDGKSAEFEPLATIDLEAKHAWDEAKGAVVASAITRMLARVATGEVVRQGSGKDSLVGALLSLGVQATLTATDTPDTRSWEALPARLAVSRQRVKPGKHVIDVSVRGLKKQQEVELSSGGFAVVAHTVLF